MKTLLLIIGLFLSTQSLAIVEGHAYQFTEGSEQENQKKAELFRELAVELRCPKCQNQNLADSNATISSDLRRELYTQIKQGNDREEIIDFMVDRYGEFVLYRPKVNSLTYALWYGPVILLALVAVIAIIIIKRRKRINDEEYQDQKQNKSALMSDEERARAEALLNSEKRSNEEDKDA